MQGTTESQMAPRRAAGFSLIEMLVVITIILILAGALMGIYGKVSAKAKMTATQAVVMSVTASLKRYAVEFDCYPPNATGGTADDGTLFKYLNGKDGRGVVANLGTPREKRFPPFMVVGKENIRADGDNLIVVDSWGQPLHYFNAKAYVDGGGDPTHCYNPTGVDIYSTGPDKMKDPDLVEPGSGTVKERAKMKLVDDITNF